MQLTLINLCQAGASMIGEMSRETYGDENFAVEAYILVLAWWNFTNFMNIWQDIFVEGKPFDLDRTVGMIFNLGFLEFNSKLLFS